MTSKDPKLNMRRNVDEIRGIAKGRQTNLTRDKENIIDYFRKQKSRSANKNCTINVISKGPTSKKSNVHHLDTEHDNYSKKLKTQIDVPILKKTDPCMGKTYLNMTMNPKKQIEKEATKKNQYGYFLTADVNSVLKAINRNSKQIPSQKRRVNMMTEQDIDKLFDCQNTSNTKKRSESKCRDQSKRRVMQTEEDLKQMTYKMRFDEKSKSRERKKPFLQTDPDLDCLNYSRKVETMKLNLKQIMTEEDPVKKDFAQSIKFLEITEDSYDKLLSAFKQEGLIKIEADPTIDKTSKFKEQFVVGKQIGEGAYASVRVAIYKPNNKKVAIKIYQKKKIKEIQRRKSVRREIKILQKIDHKNILKIYDVIETNNHVNIIMEYIPGISLSSYLKSQPGSKANEKDARKIFVPLVEAIRYLHEMCICHRDIKLENILLDGKLSPKLIDFGFSTCIENDKKVKMFCGTPSYMAPEIVVKREYKGPSADIWALGVLLYVILTGIFPFKGHTDKELYQKICASDYPKMTGISKSAEELIECMLTVDPDRRMTADEILQHEWVRQKRFQSQPMENCQKTEENTELHTKFEHILNMASYRHEKQGLAETYKQNILKQQLNKINQNTTMEKPKTCTNRQSQRIHFEPIDQKKSSSKLLQMLKAELRKKEEDREVAILEEKLTNKRYF